MIRYALEIKVGWQSGECTGEAQSLHSQETNQVLLCWCERDKIGSKTESWG